MAKKKKKKNNLVRNIAIAVVFVVLVCGMLFGILYERIMGEDKDKEAEAESPSQRTFRWSGFKPKK